MTAPPWAPAGMFHPGCGAWPRRRRRQNGPDHATAAGRRSQPAAGERGGVSRLRVGL